MIRFAWLQSRTQTVVASAVLVILAVALAVTGNNLVHLYNAVIAPCATDSSCSQTTLEVFQRNYRILRDWLTVGITVVPGIIGVFWGAPLVTRELEAGTFRLAWTQSVSRTRCIAIKLGVSLVASMAVAGLLSLMVTWWVHPLDRVRADAFSSFDQRNLVPIGYAAFGFVLGVTVGVLVRRTLPAMATVLVVFTAVRLATTLWLRSRLIAPLHLVLALDPASVGFGRTSSNAPDNLIADPPPIPNAWIYSTHLVDGAGHALTPEVVATTCPNLAPARPAGATPNGRSQVVLNIRTVLEDCVSKIGTKYHEVVAYQPGSRYWTFQWYELGIYLAAAAVLGATCIWWVRRRLN